jgi:hypothetical protein
VPLDIEGIVLYIEANIGNFHRARLQSLEGLKLEHVLRRKNPYLFRAKNILTADELVRPLLDAFLSSQEETIFGDFLEGLARHICGQVYGGKKSAAVGIDLEFQRENVTYIVAIKSGPNWGNSSQVRKMIEDFDRAKKVLRTNNPHANTIAVCGCCYGKDKQPDKGGYFKYCGQRFWEFISGDKDLYLEIIEPLGHRAKEKNEEFHQLYAQLVNKLERQFLITFVGDNNLINWKQLLEFNSGA